MEFRVLGDIEVLDGAREVPPGGPKQRALLAILVLRANKTVSRDRLIDELWGERPPASARHTLDSHVHRLRRALGSEGATLIRTRGAGYQLTVDPAAIDLTRFQRLAADGSRALAAGSNQRAAEKLIEALAMWRGPVLANLGDEPFARVEADRLEELRLAALEDRIDADLALGNHTPLVGELQTLVAEHPLRERFRSQLMLALYRSGRQAAALDTYQEAREYLVEELGIEPGKGLQELHTAILSQDTSLDPASEPQSSPVLTSEAPGGEDEPPRNGAEVAAIPPADEVPRRPAGRRHRGLLAAAGILAALGAALAVAAVSAGGGSGTAAADVDANAAAFVAPGGDAISSDTELGGHATDIAVGAGAVWVADDASGEVLKLDPSTHAVTDRVPVPQAPSSLTTGYGRVWAASSTGGVVYEIDPRSDGIVKRIAVGNGPIAIAAGAGAVWVADATDGTVRSIDPQGRTQAIVRLAEPLSDIAVGSGAVWTTSAESGVLVRIDPQTARVVGSVSVGNDPQSVAVAGGAVYVSNPPDSTVSRLDPQTGELRKIAVDGPGALAASGSSLWVSQPGDASLASIDLASGNTDGKLETGSPAVALASGGGQLAVVTGAAPTAHRGGTLRVVGGTTPDSIDPGASFTSAGFEILSLTYLGLVSYAREPGPAGTQLVASLATSVPAPSDGGRAYTFQLRPGLRYSNGMAVRPADFRVALEREYASGKGLALFGAPLLGSADCTPGHCDLSRGVEVENRTRTITFHLTKPDPDFLRELALPFGAPVPAGSPAADAGRRRLPATGPYEIRDYVPGKSLDLVRNPHYASSEGSPEGFVDRIAVTLGRDPAQQVAAVRSGHADAMLDTPPPATLPGLLKRSATQAHPYVEPTLFGLFLDTRRPPFASLAARRAVNYAVDRAAVVRLAGGRAAALPTCQVLPEGFPGYAPYCPYTAGSKTAGTWRRPDLRRARALVRASGTAGARVSVASDIGDPAKVRIARYFVGLLDRLGYRAELRVFGNTEVYSSHVGRPSSTIDSGTYGWIADFPAASDFFRALFTCRAATPAAAGVVTNASGLCEPALDRRIRRATGLEDRSVAAADTSWRAIDRTVTRQAPWVSLLNPRSADYVSKRLGNYQRNPELGILLDQVWVR